MPAIAPDAFTTSRMFFGAGINPASVLATSADASLFVVDPTDGTLNSTVNLTRSAVPQLVGQQSFADGVFFQTKSPGYLPDNVADLNLQADQNGQIWFNWGSFTGTPNTAVGIDLNYASGTTTTTDIVTGAITSSTAGPPSPQPIYYSPAATGQGTSGCQLFAAATGSLYETSPTVSDWNVNRTGPPPAPYPATFPVFTPYLYLGVNPKKITDAAFGAAPLGKDPLQQFVVKQLVGGEVPPGLPLPPDDPALTVTRTHLGPRTQVTASPLMVVDNTGLQKQKALFLLYDPDNGCTGRSYVVILTFQVSTACAAPAITSIVSIGAGVGAASGFTLTDNKLFAAKSGVGRGENAGVIEVPVPVNTLAGIPQFVPVWWRDVK